MEPRIEDRQHAGRSRSEDVDLLTRYMREMGGARRLDRAREFELGSELQDARIALTAILTDLPEPWRSRVLALDGPPDGAWWPMEKLEACYERLIGHGASADCEALAAVADIAVGHKCALDAARDNLILANLPLVVDAAKRYGYSGVPLLDLVQEGNVGLIEAVERFDPHRGFRFATYAVWWIKRAFAKAFTDKARLIRLPENATQAVRRIRATEAELARELGRDPAEAEVAARLRLPVAKIAALRAASGTPRRLEPFGEDGEGAGLIGTLPDLDARDPLEQLLQRELQCEVERTFEILTPRQREVLRLRFGFGGTSGRTLSEVGKILGLSRERIRQIERAALERVRKERGRPHSG